MDGGTTPTSAYHSPPESRHTTPIALPLVDYRHVGRGADHVIDHETAFRTPMMVAPPVYTSTQLRHAPTAYHVATGPSDRDYRRATGPSDRDYHKATGPSDRDYHRTTGPSDRDYHRATGLPDRDYHRTTAPIDYHRPTGPLDDYQRPLERNYPRAVGPQQTPAGSHMSSGYYSLDKLGMNRLSMESTSEFTPLQPCHDDTLSNSKSILIEMIRYIFVF